MHLRFDGHGLEFLSGGVPLGFTDAKTAEGRYAAFLLALCDYHELQTRRAQARSEGRPPPRAVWEAAPAPPMPAPSVPLERLQPAAGAYARLLSAAGWRVHVFRSSGEWRAHAGASPAGHRLAFVRWGPGQADALRSLWLAVCWPERAAAEVRS